MALTRRRGGAQIGWVSASWPLAGIEVGPGRLRISSLGTYEFSPAEVSAIEEVGALPFLSQGIRIHHTKARYPERVVFYTPTGRVALLAALRDAGFSTGAPVLETPRGFPLRMRAVVAVAVFWNMLFLLDQPHGVSGRWVPGLFVLLALAMLFGLATLLPKSARLQSVFMRNGRDVGEVASLLRLVQLVSGLMLLGFSLAHVLR